MLITLQGTILQLHFINHTAAAAAAAKSHQLWLTLCDPIDGSPPGSSIPRILQARILEWVAISFSNAWKWKVKVKSLSRVQLFETPWTVAYEAPPSMGLSRQEYWQEMPLPSPLSITVCIYLKLYITHHNFILKRKCNFYFFWLIFEQKCFWKGMHFLRLYVIYTYIYINLKINL